MFRSGALAIAAACLVNAMAQARPLTPAEGRYWPYSGVVPGCAEAAVLSRIQSRFSQRERTYWHSGLEISAFSDVRETGLRTAGVDLIPKRYCKARAIMNDGRVRQVRYWVGEALGMAGGAGYFGLASAWGVEWCIAGLDHNNAFAPNCRAAGP